MNIQIKSLHKLDVYIDGEQKAICPKCSGKSEFLAVDDDRQQHKCSKCNYEFFLDSE